jgi:phage terminase large subunit-like protein
MTNELTNYGLRFRGRPATCDSWQDAVWPKTNPSLLVTPSRDYLREQVPEATRMPAREARVRRLNFGEWLEGHTRWLSMADFHASACRADADDLVGVPCLADLDLGQSDDFTAFARLWLLEDGRVVVRMRFWIPESVLTAFPNRPYDVWRRGGHLVVTEGTTTNYDVVEAEVIELCRKREIAYDKRFAERMALHFQNAGLVAIDTPQGFQLNEALVRLSDLVKERRLVHDGNPVLAWMAANAIVRHGVRGDIRLDKEKSGDKVDGLAAIAMAMARAIIVQDTGSIYDKRGMLIL